MIQSAAVTQGGAVLFWVWRLVCGAAKQIVDTDTVEISEFQKCVNRVIQDADLILGIGVLADVQQLGNLLLRVIMVNSQVADILKFQDFFSPTITTPTIQYLKRRYSILSEFQIKYLREVSIWITKECMHFCAAQFLMHWICCRHRLKRRVRDGNWNRRFIRWRSFTWRARNKFS